MTRSVLFFGDSNTRGYGVGRDGRYAALVEAALRGGPRGEWRVAVATTQSDFRLIRARLEAAIAEREPDIIVWPCPTGPLAYFTREPRWYRRARKVSRWLLQAVKEHHIRRDIARAGGEDERPRRDALYEGRYVDDLYHWMPHTWPGVRNLRPFFAARYGTIVKATEEQYLGRMRRYRERLRATGASLLFTSIFPHSEAAYPTFNARVTAANTRLASLLHEPDAGCVYVDLYGALTRSGIGAHLLSDGMHLSPGGHRLVANLLTPQLLALMHTHDRRRAPAPSLNVSVNESG